MNQGKTLFAQLMDFVPWTSFSRIVNHYHGDSGVRSLPCSEQFRAMAFAQLTFRESLRDIECCLLSNHSKLYSMGFRSPVKRSTLANANEKRDWHIWQNLAQLLINKARKLYSNDSFGINLASTAYAFDTTTIDLCLSLFSWAPFRSTKAAVKLHTLLDLRGNIPCFVHITEGKTHEVNVLDILPFETGAIYLLDRGFLDFKRLFNLHQTGAFFITRAKHNLNAHRVYSMKTNRNTGIICDQRILLDGHYAAQDYPELIRRIRYKDGETGKTLVFLTNNTVLPALTIARLYKSRWQVELFFKWIKQHLRIKRFIGNSENAVKTQIWCAITAYLLLAIAKKELNIETSMYTLLQIFSVSAFEKTEISQAFRPEAKRDHENTADKQLILFN